MASKTAICLGAASMKYMCKGKALPLLQLCCNSPQEETARQWVLKFFIMWAKLFSSLSSSEQAD